RGARERLRVPALITLNMNIAGLERNIRQVEQNHPEAMEAAVRTIGEVVSDIIKSHAPRDTNRYIASWLDAANQAGLGPYIVPPIIRGKLADRFETILEGQIATLRRLIRKYERR